MLAGSIDEAKQLVERFEKTHPNSPLKLHEQILRARVLNADAAALLKEASRPDRPTNTAKAEKERREAIATLEKVIAESHLPRTQVLARFYLGRTLEDTGDFSRAVDTLAPLVSPGRPAQGFVGSDRRAGPLRARARRHRKIRASPSAADEIHRAAAQGFTDRTSPGRPGRRARTTQSASTSRLPTWISWSATFRTARLRLRPIRRLAELSYDTQDFKTARDRFAKLAELGEPKSDVRRMGLSGLGWSQFELKAFDQSTAAFAEVFEKFPTDTLQVAEAGYMRARALQQAGKLSDAAQAYAQVFDKLLPFDRRQSLARSCAVPAQYGFLSGIQAANLLAQLKRYDDADAAYRRLADHYPKAGKLSESALRLGQLVVRRQERRGPEAADSRHLDPHRPGVPRQRRRTQGPSVFG